MYAAARFCPSISSSDSVGVGSGATRTGRVLFGWAIDSSLPFCRPEPVPVVRRRDRRRAEGDARGEEGAARPGMSAGGHITGMPSRSLHARGAGAPGDNYRLSGLGGISRFAQPDSPAVRPRRPRLRSVAATARGRMGVRGGRGGGRIHHLRGVGRRLAYSIPVPVIQARRLAATSPGCRRAACTARGAVVRGDDCRMGEFRRLGLPSRASRRLMPRGHFTVMATRSHCACTPVAQLRWAIDSSCPSSVGITRFAPPAVGGPFRRRRPQS